MADLHEPTPRERIRECTERYLPGTETAFDVGSPVVHRSVVAQAFDAGWRAKLESGDVIVGELEEAIADAFEEYCEEAFTE